MIEKMNRLRELRGLRRSIAERDVERARAEKSEFERRVREAEDAHGRAVTDSSSKRRKSMDALMAAPASPLNVARMANVNAAIDHEIATAATTADEEREGLAEASEDLEGKQDVLVQFLKKEQAAEGALDRFAERTRHLPDPDEEPED